MKLTTPHLIIHLISIIDMKTKKTPTRETKPAIKKARKSEFTDLQISIFAAACNAESMHAPEREYKFDEINKRKWPFDFAWPEHKIALEIEGAVWTNGRHTRGSGFVKDLEKYNEAAMQGWAVLRAERNDFLRHTAKWAANVKRIAGRQPE